MCTPYGSSLVGKCQDIPDMLRTANNQLQGKLKYVIKDIE